MRYYAYLKQKGEGCDYTIGCGNTLVTVDADNDEDARTKLGELIEEEYTGERELESVQLFKDKISFNLDKVYDSHRSKKDSEAKRLQHLKDMEEFERLKRKLGK